jgi:hypothetical protein
MKFKSKNYALYLSNKKTETEFEKRTRELRERIFNLAREERLFDESVRDFFGGYASNPQHIVINGRVAFCQWCFIEISVCKGSCVSETVLS